MKNIFIRLFSATILSLLLSLNIYASESTKNKTVQTEVSYVINEEDPIRTLFSRIFFMI